MLADDVYLYHYNLLRTNKSYLLVLELILPYLLLQYYLFKFWILWEDYRFKLNFGKLIE
jgi:hypothetical protein